MSTFASQYGVSEDDVLFGPESRALEAAEFDRGGRNAVVANVYDDGVNTTIDFGAGDTVTIEGLTSGSSGATTIAAYDAALGFRAAGTWR